MPSDALFDTAEPWDETPPPAPLDLSGLNETQRKAVEHTEGPLLVLAGAGTGKTRVLITRIAQILSRRLAWPSQILAVTFTNKAAREMQQRITDLVGEQATGLWLGTFHSLCLRILRRHAELIDFPPNFVVLDADDQLRLIKTLMEEQRLDVKRFPPRVMHAIIERWKDKAIMPDAAAQHGGEAHEVKLYETYQARLQRMGAMDFGDLLLYSIRLFQRHPAILADYHKRFKYMLVDEYQDTNVAQYLWLKLLAIRGDHRPANLCCVGDDDQSIYGWRGAEVENILRFERDFSDENGVQAPVIRLEENYRSTPHILGAASHLISFNEDRLGKTLYCSATEGEKVKLIPMIDDRAEAEFVCACVENAQREMGITYQQCAVLVRAGHQTRSFEEAFIAAGIPYRIVGGLRFYERQEIRDAIAYIRAAVMPENDLSLERIINNPKRGLGNVALQQLRDTAQERNISLMQSVRDSITAKRLKPKLEATLKQLSDHFTRWQQAFASGRPHWEVVEQIFNESGYLAMWKNSKAAEAPGRVDNLKELLGALRDFESIEQFLEHVSLVADSDSVPDDNMVSVMTMHAAKGLEFEVVFACGWEEGLFPSQRAMDENGKRGLEEERRLAYVAITRARKHLAITYAMNRFTYGKQVASIPSRFVDELPAEHIEEVQVARRRNGAYNSGYGGSHGGGYNKQPAQSSNGFSAEKHRYRNVSGGSNASINNTSLNFTEEGQVGGVSMRCEPEGERSHEPAKQRSIANSGEFAGSNQKSFSPNQSVFHTMFGKGTVLSVSGSHVKVRFSGGEIKTLMADYLKRAV